MSGLPPRPKPTPEEALRFILDRINDVEAREGSLALELVFIRAKAKAALGLPQIEGER